MVKEFSRLGPMGFTSQVEEGFPTLKNLCHYSICSIFYYLLIVSASAHLDMIPLAKYRWFFDILWNQLELEIS